MHEVFPAMLLSTTTFVVVSWLRRSEPPETVQGIFDTVRSSH
jgi:hypothetical protein